MAVAHPIPRLQTFVSLPEIDHLVRSLKAFIPEDVGSSAWLEQHHALESLGLQARADAAAARDEPVKEAFVLHDRVSLLIADLLVTEAWTQRALPALRDVVAARGGALVSAAITSHAGVVAGLLEVLLHHPDATAALSEDAALELCDWGCRRVAGLAAVGATLARRPDRSPKALLDLSPAEEMREREEEAEFGCGLAAVTILRHLTDHAGAAASLAVLHRAAATSGLAGALAPLLAHPPWERPGKGGKERWEGGRWAPVPPAALHRPGAADVQAWLLLATLVLDPGAAAKMDWEGPTGEGLLQLRSRLTPALIEAVPPLTGLLRFLEAGAVGAAAQWHGPDALRRAQQARSVVIEQPPRLRAALLKGVDWAALIERQRETHFNCSGASGGWVSQELLGKILANIDFLCDVHMQNEAQGGPTPALTPPCVRVEAYSAAGDGWTWQATHRLRLALDRPPEPVDVVKAEKWGEGAALREAVAPGTKAPAPATVGGRRYRLEGLGEAAAQLLPPEGKLIVGFCDVACEATVSLPAPPTR